MKRPLFIAITAVLVLLSGSCFSEPRIAFEETTHNFGEVGKELNLKHVFKFRNLGGATLVIRKIEAG